MAVSTPIAAHRIAITGCVANQATMTGMGNDTLRLSFVSLRPTPGHGLRFGSLATGSARTPRILRGTRTAPACASQCQPDSDADAWRSDGRMLPARYRVHMLNVNPSQETPKSKAFASA